VELTPCNGHGGTCKNNGQFEGLCYFCHVANLFDGQAAPSLYVKSTREIESATTDGIATGLSRALVALKARGLHEAAGVVRELLEKLVDPPTPKETP
jgi:hypothetical protein